MPMQGTKSSHCLHIPAALDTVLTTPSEKPWQSLPGHAPTEKKRFVGAITTTGIPCILETCVGLLAALGDPPSACLRVANKPVRTSARDITLALSTKLCCITRAQLHVDRSLLACNRCRRNISGHTIYMYSDMGFCSNDCRCDYYVDEVEECKKRLAMALMEQISKMPRVVTRNRMAPIRAKQLAEGSHRPTFFTCAKAE